MNEYSAFGRWNIASLKGSSVIIVNEDSAFNDAVQKEFDSDHIFCRKLTDIKTALTWVRRQRPDLIIIDWCLKKNEAMTLLSRLKKHMDTRNITIMMIVPPNSENTVIDILQIGVDGCVMRPFSVAEFMARTRAIIRRNVKFSYEPVLDFGELKIEVETRRVVLQGKNIDLSPTEFRLLKMFVTYKNQVFSRSQLMSQLRIVDSNIGERTIDVHILRLRKAFANVQPHYAGLIKTVRGSGYKFVTDVDI